jgi:hypothetical protein
MSPRLYAIGTYRRAYKSLIRRADRYTENSPEHMDRLRLAAMAYRAMHNEIHPEKAQERP